MPPPSSGPVHPGLASATPDSAEHSSAPGSTQVPSGSVATRPQAEEQRGRHPFPPPRWPPASGSFWQIYYWEADSRNETEKMRVLFLPETTAKLKNLTSHTQYLVSISAFNAAGDGPRSDPRQGRTHQAGRRTRASFPQPGAPPCPGAVPRPSLSIPSALRSARPVSQIPRSWEFLGPIRVVSPAPSPGLLRGAAP